MDFFKFLVVVEEVVVEEFAIVVVVVDVIHIMRAFPFVVAIVAYNY
jgi:hypothetical protein